MTADINTPEGWFAQFGPIETSPRTRFQKVAAKMLTASATTIPHVTHHDEVDISVLEEHRRGRADKVSPLIFIVKAVVDALKAYPQFNASLTPDGATLIEKRYYHIGIAVDGPLGLLVPVLRDCDTKDVATLAAELAALSARARDKGLPAEAMAGGCFSISSLGGIGGTGFTPIVNAPEVAILGVTRTRIAPVWTGSGFEPRPMLPLSLSYDHRVINGADAARFVRHVGEALRTPAA